MTDSLAVFLRQHISQQAQGRIPFVEFMDWVLYHPEQGYYSQGLGLGKAGDFFTSSHLGPYLGELLAQQFWDCWQRLGKPEPFTLLEMGAGQGWLAGDILQAIWKRDSQWASQVRYQIVERSSQLRDRQRQHLQPLLAQWPQMEGVDWVTWEDLEPETLVGCCFSNELVDAFPVHRLRLHQGQVQEVYVTWMDHGSGLGQWQEQYDRPSTDQLLRYFQDLGIDLTHPTYPDGYSTEVNLAAQNWLGTVASKLQRGYLITIDYGYNSDRYHHPQRYQGTLQCYYQHRRHSDPYQYLGQQDITAHVNFTALKQWGQQMGLEVLGFTRQALFLMALGLGDRLQALDQIQDLQTLLQQRDALHQLLDPTGLGNFGVLIQGKGLRDDRERQLLGLHDYT